MRQGQYLEDRLEAVEELREELLDELADLRDEVEMLQVLLAAR